jgi:hypothetical protein
MAGADRGGQQRDRLLRELLALVESLGRSQRPVAGVKLLFLFAVDDRPLGLVPNREQGGIGTRAHDLILPPSGEAIDDYCFSRRQPR